MERPRNLETQAIAIKDMAKNLLKKPDLTEIILQYRLPYGPDHTLTLRAINYWGKKDSWMKDTRYIYLDKIRDDKRSEVIFSHDFNESDSSGELDEFSLALIPPQPFGVPPEATTLLQNAIAYAKGDQIKKVTVDNLFAQLIHEGSSMTEKTVRRKLENSSKLYIIEKTLEGSAEHHHVHFLHDPQLEIGLQQQEKWLEIHQLRNGRFESVITGDPLAEAASLARKEDIRQDDEGNIVGVWFSESDKATVLEAERAMGLRNLKPNIVDAIQKALIEVTKNEK